jgi:hypothetical protein
MPVRTVDKDCQLPVVSMSETSENERYFDTTSSGGQDQFWELRQVGGLSETGTGRENVRHLPAVVSHSREPVGQ